MLDNSQASLPSFLELTDKVFDNIELTKEEIKDVIVNLDPNTTSGPDMISNKMIIKIAPDSKATLYHIIKIAADSKATLYHIIKIAADSKATLYHIIKIAADSKATLYHIQSIAV